MKAYYLIIELILLGAAIASASNNRLELAVLIMILIELRAASFSLRY